MEKKKNSSSLSFIHDQQQIVKKHFSHSNCITQHQTSKHTKNTPHTFKQTSQTKQTYTLDLTRSYLTTMVPLQPFDFFCFLALHVIVLFFFSLFLFFFFIFFGILQFLFLLQSILWVAMPNVCSIKSFFRCT